MGPSGGNETEVKIKTWRFESTWWTDKPARLIIRLLFGFVSDSVSVRKKWKYWDGNAVLVGRKPIYSIFRLSSRSYLIFHATTNVVSIITYIWSCPWISLRTGLVCIEFGHIILAWYPGMFQNERNKTTCLNLFVIFGCFCSFWM